MNSLIINDLHGGSKYGLIHPDWQSKRTFLVSKWLYDKWCEYQLLLPKEIDLLILNGDLIDGPNVKERSSGILETSLSEQVEMCIKILEPLVKRCKTIIRLDGSGYHEQRGDELRLLDEYFHTRKPRDYRDEVVQNIELPGKVILNVKHEPESGKVLYKGTALNREIIHAIHAEASRGYPKANILIRGHLHSYSMIDIDNKQMIINPCWCLAKPRDMKKHYYQWSPCIGGTLLIPNKMCHHGYQIVTTYWHPPHLGSIKI
mgnify:FL=1